MILHRRLVNNSTSYISEDKIRSNGTYLAGDIVFYNKSINKLIVVDPSVDLKNVDMSVYIPIAIIVIPSNHNVYGNGNAAAMSLVYMNDYDPENGSVNSEFSAFGNPGIPTADRFPRISNLNTVEGDVIDFTEQGVFLPSDMFSVTQCAHDTNAYYELEISSSSNLAPSPYLTDGSRNPNYYIRSANQDTHNNVFSHFDGKEECEKVISGYSGENWKTDVPLVTTVGMSNPIICAWRFYTSGTNPGDWYIPAAGEYGYLVAREKTIEKSLNILKEAGIECLDLSAVNQILVSTRYDENNIIRFHHNYAHVDADFYYNYTGNVAFIQIPANL